MSDNPHAVTVALSRAQVCTAIKTGAVLLGLLAGVVSVPFIMAAHASLGFLMIAALLLASSALALDEVRVALRSLVVSSVFAAILDVFLLWGTGGESGCALLAMLMATIVSFFFFCACLTQGTDFYPDHPSPFVDAMRDFANGASMFGRFVLSLPRKAMRVPAAFGCLLWSVVTIVYERLSPGCERETAATESTGDA